MKAMRIITWEALLWLFLLSGAIETGRVRAFCLSNYYCQPFRVTAKRTASAPDTPPDPADEDECDDSGESIRSKAGIGRRDTLRSLFGSAVSLAAWEMGWNMATTNVAAIVERVMTVGNKYQGAAIASEELTGWIATQTVASKPEIQAWLTAQKRLQAIRKTTLAMTTAVTRTKTVKRAAPVVAGIEEGAIVATASLAIDAIKDDVANESCGTNLATNRTAIATDPVARHQNLTVATSTATEQDTNSTTTTDA